MEVIGVAYLYTLATLSMTFVGFTAIVLFLRQALGHHLSRFDALLAQYGTGYDRNRRLNAAAAFNHLGATANNGVALVECSGRSPSALVCFDISEPQASGNQRTNALVPMGQFLHVLADWIKFSG
jgi:hypothetical protein